MNDSNQLEIKNVTKLYPNQCGIKGISTTMCGGEIVSFVGPNGAGKTTLVKSIAGLSRIAEGSILLNGNLTSEPVSKSQIGYMQEDLSFYEKMTVYEILDFMCKVKFKDQYYETIDDYLIRYELYDKRNTYIDKLSLGMRRKLAIVMALLGDTQLVILDEPTNGVDTAGILQLKHDLSKRVKQGAIVIITSHVLDWVEKICTRCIFLKEGEVVEDIEVGTRDLENEYQRVYDLVK